MERRAEKISCNDFNKVTMFKHRHCEVWSMKFKPRVFTLEPKSWYWGSTSKTQPPCVVVSAWPPPSLFLAFILPNTDIRLYIQERVNVNVGHSNHYLYRQSYRDQPTQTKIAPIWPCWQATTRVTRTAENHFKAPPADPCRLHHRHTPSLGKGVPLKNPFLGHGYNMEKMLN